MVASTKLPLSKGVHNQRGAEIRGIKHTVHTDVLPAVCPSSILVTGECDNVVGVLHGRTTGSEITVGIVPSG